MPIVVTLQLIVGRLDFLGEFLGRNNYLRNIETGVGTFVVVLHFLVRNVNRGSDKGSQLFLPDLIAQPLLKRFYVAVTRRDSFLVTVEADKLTRRINKLFANLFGNFGVAGSQPKPGRFLSNHAFANQTVNKPLVAA